MTVTETTYDTEAPANSFEAERKKQRDAAARRIASRTDEREQKRAAIEAPLGLVEADDPERIATRIDRLSRYYPDVRPVSPTALARHDRDAVRAAGAVLERIINTPDFVDIRYLEGGTKAARAVGRVDIRNENGRLIGYGTGSLVSSRLLLTNHHVLPNAATAAASGIEFRYEDGLDGQPLQPILLALDPRTFFLTDEKLDFALVAVAAGGAGLAQFGFNRLIAAEGKAIPGDFVTIVQHPKGEKKQVALRDNRIVDVADAFLHYEADTEPGSSGSPVFNDQWEIVGLHHASVPAPEHPELGKIVNEGIRVSRLLKFVGDHALPPAQKALVRELVGAERIVVPGSGPNGSEAARGTGAAPVSVTTAPSTPASAATVTVPIEIAVRVTGAAVSGPNGSVDGAGAAAVVAEGIRIDPDFTDREGYDPSFLGTGALAVPLPTLPEDLVPLASINKLATTEPRYVLPYHHFSTVQNKERRLAFFTAVNIDGALGRRLKREQDHWFFDPRIPKDEQTGKEVYDHNDLDLGHLVRRLDPAWGSTPDVVKNANDDTFHFTNCTPQHKDFNRLQTRWAGLEDYILDHADNSRFRVCVFTGPVLAADDQEYRGVQLPRQFWKVVVMVKEGGVLSATAYLLSQEELIRGLEADLEAFDYGAYRTYQVPVSRIEELTSLSFGSLADADPLARDEALLEPKEVERLDDIVL
jgi:endonuclease G, mitochondrial